jgi:hypothetical protein
VRRCSDDDGSGVTFFKYFSVAARPPAMQKDDAPPARQPPQCLAVMGVGQTKSRESEPTARGIEEIGGQKRPERMLAIVIGRKFARVDGQW